MPQTVPTRAILDALGKPKSTSWRCSGLGLGLGLRSGLGLGLGLRSGLGDGSSTTLR